MCTQTHIPIHTQRHRRTHKPNRHTPVSPLQQRFVYKVTQLHNTFLLPSSLILSPFSPLPLQTFQILFPLLLLSFSTYCCAPQLTSPHSAAVPLHPLGAFSSILVNCVCLCTHVYVCVLSMCSSVPQLDWLLGHH